MCIHTTLYVTPSHHKSVRLNASVTDGIILVTFPEINLNCLDARDAVRRGTKRPRPGSSKNYFSRPTLC